MPSVKKAPIAAIRAGIETLSHIAVILAVPFFFVQLRESASLQRADATMTFIRLANEQHYADLVARLSEPWQGVNVRAFLARRPSPAAIAQFKLVLTRAIRDRDIEQLAEFYKSVLVCRELSYCDQALIDSFYRQSISTFYCSYDIRLRMIANRLNWPDYAQRLAEYAGRC